MKKTFSLKRSLPFGAIRRRSCFVITDDNELRTLAFTPDTPVKKTSVMPEKSLNTFLSEMDSAGTEILTFFHDHFFGGGERELHLTHPEFRLCTKKIADAAAEHGIGIGASVVNPLDLGRTFAADIGVGGCHRTFAEGEVDSEGNFCFNAYLAKRWCNNKGYIYPEFSKARLFVYREEKAPDSPYITVPFESIRELPPQSYTCTPSDEPWENSESFGNSHMTVAGHTDLSGNRIFAVFYMITPEMDYFHPRAQEYIHGIIDSYSAEGIEFLELYSDEMHIQFDWDFAHFGPHEIPTRYMTENFQNTLAKSDPIFSDFDKALIYMGYDMETDRKNYAQTHTQHVLGTSPDLLIRTFRLRSTYYETLQDRVVGLCCEARDYIRNTYVKNQGEDPLCLGHATWQESPTCDKYTELGVFTAAPQNGKCSYDYTPDYVYSSTIREAISGCYDYFKWNDYFSYGGVDHCECGWFDRNYYGGALAASLGAMNRNQVASWGAWGFPHEVARRFNALSISYGTFLAPWAMHVTWGRPRSVDVLYVYPKHLTAVEEAFGSWMVQFGYTNYLPADRLLALGRVENGKLVAGIGKYSTVVVGFEPFYSEELTEMLSEFARQGGTLVWNATPPHDEKGAIPQKWLELFGLKKATTLFDSLSAEKIEFCGSLSSLAPLSVPTTFLPDRIYPIVPDEKGETVALASGNAVGVKRSFGRGQVCYFGFRLRDDQTGDSADSPSTLFDLLKALGAYGKEDNTETISRHGDIFASRFENGTVSICNHTRKLVELWEGTFSRDNEKDAKVLENYPYLESIDLELSDFAVNGHRISYCGSEFLQFRPDENGGLSGFWGRNTTGLTLDGKEYRFCAEPSEIMFAELDPERVPEGYSHGLVIRTSADKLELPFAPTPNAEIFCDRGGDGLDLTKTELSFCKNLLTLGSYKGSTLIVLEK